VTDGSSPLGGVEPRIAPLAPMSSELTATKSTAMTDAAAVIGLLPALDPLVRSCMPVRARGRGYRVVRVRPRYPMCSGWASYMANSSTNVTLVTPSEAQKTVMGSPPCFEEKSDKRRGRVIRRADGRDCFTNPRPGR
jgi:hypothetical protein